MTYVAFAVLLVSTAFAPLVRKRASVRPPRAAHIPGQPIWVRDRPPLRFRTWAATAAGAWAITAVLALTVPSYAVATALVGAAVLGLMFAMLSRYASGCDEVRAAVDALAPLVAMPYAGKVGVHIGMWSPWVERAGLPWVIVAHTPALFDQLAAMYPQVPIVHGKIPASVQVALYCHGAAANSDFIAGSDATHVFLGHGDSDKPLSASQRVLQYDVIAVAGQAAIDRFASAGLAVPEHKLRVIGRPQTEGIAGPRKRKGKGKPTVLYAPTWRHADDDANVSSLAVADRLVAALLERGCDVIFRRHFAGQNHLEAEAMIQRVNQMLAAASGNHCWGVDAMEQPLIEAFNAADVMVSDVSGIVVDFMASSKPLVMYAAQYSDADAFRVSHPTARAAYVVDRDLRLLDQALDQALGSDPLASVRRTVADEYLGGSDRKDPAARFIALVRQLAEKG